MSRRRGLGVAGAVVVAAAVVAWLRFEPRPRQSAPDGAGLGAAAPAPAGERMRDGAAPTARARPAVPAPASGAGAAADDEVDELDGDARAAAWAAVDLAAVRRALPDNIYWQVAAPTTDERIIEERAAERERWNVEYGKVLSGTATEAEIRGYYDHRARLSGDYVEFTTYLLDHYGEQLPERDVGLLHLARRLHLARLEELPRQVEESFERKRQQDEARARWLADEAAFGAPKSP